MQNILKSLAFGSLVILLISCGNEDYQTDAEVDADYLHQAVQEYTDVMVFDIFSPPQASRNYAYPSLAAYEILAQGDSTKALMKGRLNGFEGIRAPDPGSPVNLEIAALEAFYKVGKAFIYSEDKLEAGHTRAMKKLAESGHSAEVIAASRSYGDSVALDIMRYVKADGYNVTRTMSQYTFKGDVMGKWTPTPPNFMDPIEPNWSKLRSFTLDSATQFAPPRPSSFDMTEGSKFRKEVQEVYEIGRNLTDEQKEIAAFWDCNPYVVLHESHHMRPVKKITPGGHWMGIARIAGIKLDASMADAAEIYCWASIALADGFISCWDEKYRSNYIRPETVINTWIDPGWAPSLQTPPFPEYTSGHSVISTATAITLTELLGENFSFTDSVEVKYGLEPRQFDSFLEASSEAALSRLYGGIHFMPAIEEGVNQGRRVGQKVIETLKG